jgi:diguanylate cyclase
MEFGIVFANIASLALLLAIAFLSFRRKTQAGAVEFGIVALFGFALSLCSFFEIEARAFESMLLWRNITQVGAFYIPAAVFVFALAYTGSRMALIRAVGAGLYAFQSIPLALILTDQAHHLMRSSVGAIISKAGFAAISVKQTFLGAVFVSINYVVIAASIVILVLFAIKAGAIARRQVLIIVVGIMIPETVLAMKNMFGDGFLGGVPGSSAFAIGSSIVVAGIYGFGFLSISPIARDRAFDVIDEGLLVCSPKGHVIDLNPAARTMLARHIDVSPEELGPAAYGDRLRRGLGRELASRCVAEEVRFCLPLSGRAGTAHYALRAYELKNGISIVGYTGVLRDVSDETTRTELLTAKAERDSLTGIYNRSAFSEIVGERLLLSTEGAFLLVLDIDDFKSINDTYGHLAGDMVLKGVSECCRKTLRGNDVFGRIGGDEFAAFLPGIEKDNALPLAQRIRSSVERARIEFEGRRLSATISVGLAGTGRAADLPRAPGYEALFSKADAALYRSKENGRNQVTISDGDSFVEPDPERPR